MPDTETDALIRAKTERMTHGPNMRPSVGAVAREVCRSLDPKSPTRLLLEALLASSNFANTDRAAILDEVRTIINAELFAQLVQNSNDRWTKEQIGKFELGPSDTLVA